MERFLPQGDGLGWAEKAWGPLRALSVQLELDSEAEGALEAIQTIVFPYGGVNGSLERGCDLP